MDTRKGWNGFIEACLQLRTPKELEEFFELFLTMEEKNLMASRYLIIKSLLEEKLPQRSIASLHHVSIAQITRGSNALKRLTPAIKQYLKNILKK